MLATLNTRGANVCVQLKLELMPWPSLSSRNPKICGLTEDRFWNWKLRAKRSLRPTLCPSRRPTLSLLTGTVVVNWKFCAAQAEERPAEQEPVWLGWGIYFSKPSAIGLIMLVGI